MIRAPITQTARIVLEPWHVDGVLPQISAYLRRKWLLLLLQPVPHPHVPLRDRVVRVVLVLLHSPYAILLPL